MRRKKEMPLVKMGKCERNNGNGKGKGYGWREKGISKREKGISKRAKDDERREKEMGKVANNEEEKLLTKKVKGRE